MNFVSMRDIDGVNDQDKIVMSIKADEVVIYFVRYTSITALLSASPNPAASAFSSKPRCASDSGNPTPARSPAVKIK